MAVSPGIYYLTIEKALIDTLGESLEAEDHYVGLVDNNHTPAFDTDDFVNDIDNEITGGNYGRETITSTELTVAAGVLKYDGIDIVYDNSGSDDVTIVNAEGAFQGLNVGSDATDPLLYLSDFGAAFSCTNSTFTIQWNASGIFTIDLVP